MAKLDPRAVAFWRFEQLQQATEEHLHRCVRGKLLRDISRVPVRWPWGVTKPIQEHQRAMLEAWNEYFGS